MNAHRPVAGPARPAPPAGRGQAASGPHSPVQPDGTGLAIEPDAGDEWIAACGRVKVRLGKRLDERLPAYRHPWEHPGCAGCDRGFVDVDGGDRVAPCPACRAAREGVCGRGQ